MLINIDNDSSSPVTPIFCDTIFDCIELNNCEDMYSTPIQFTIESDESYDDNAPICIKSVDYSYKCIGLTTPNSFYLCGNANTFNPKDYLCQCTSSTIPDIIEAEKNATIISADRTIELANLVLSATNLEDKRSKAIATVQSLGKTVLLAAKTVNDLINFKEPSPTANSINQAIVYLSDATRYIADAADKSTVLLDGLTDQEVLITKIALDIYNPSVGVDSALEYIINAANIVKNYPNAPESAISAANSALNSAETTKTTAMAIAENPGSQTLSQINTLVLGAYVSAAYLYNAINDLMQSIGNSSLQQYMESIGEVLYAIYLLNYSTQAIDDSNSYNENTQLSILDSAARAAIDAAKYSKLAVNFMNSQTIINLYDEFSISLDPAQCKNLNCCCKDKFTKKSNTSKQIFFQTISSFKVCNLKICICGTIGSKKFTATAYYKGVTSLEDIGFDSIKISSVLFIPKNTDFTLTEKLNPCFSVKSVIPTDNYDKDNPKVINASIYSHLKLDTSIFVSIKQTI